MKQALILLIAIVPLPVATASAQSSPLMQPSPVWAAALSSRTLELADTAAPRPETHWVRGAVIGGAVLGVGTALFAAAWCDGDSGTESCGSATAESFLIGAAVGAGIGAFIGARFPKRPTDGTPVPVH